MTSRSILKSPEDRRLVAIPANEGPDGPAPIDDMDAFPPMNQDPFMKDFNQEMERIQKDLSGMQYNMLTPFPNNNNYEASPFNGSGMGMGFPPPTLAPPPMHLPPMSMGLPPPPNGGFPDFPSLPPPPSMDLVPFPPNGTGAPNDMQAAIMDMPPAPIGPTPVIKDSRYGYKVMELVLDVKGYQPEDIHINTEGNVLQVFARRLSVKHESARDGSADAKTAREFRRQYSLPEVVRAENLRCFVKPDGQLMIEGPLGSNVIQTRKNKKKVKFAALYK